MTITPALIERATEIVYNETHKHGYANTWTNAHDKNTWRAALAKALAEVHQ